MLSDSKGTLTAILDLDPLRDINLLEWMLHMTAERKHISNPENHRLGIHQRMILHLSILLNRRIDKAFDAFLMIVCQ